MQDEVAVVVKRLHRGDIRMLENEGAYGAGLRFGKRIVAGTVLLVPWLPSGCKVPVEEGPGQIQADLRTLDLVAMDISIHVHCRALFQWLGSAPADLDHPELMSQVALADRLHPAEVRKRFLELFQRLDHFVVAVE